MRLRLANSPLLLSTVTLVSTTLALTVLAQTAQQSPPSEAQHPAMPSRQAFGAQNTVAIHIRLLNGKTGKPIADKEIFLERSKTHLMSHAEDHDIKTDATGLAEATVDRAGDIQNPIVIDYRSCTPRIRHAGDAEKAQRFPVAQILSTGLVAQNHCGKTTQPATPGELTLYFRTMNVFERMTD